VRGRLRCRADDRKKTAHQRKLGLGRRMLSRHEIQVKRVEPFPENIACARNGSIPPCVKRGEQKGLGTGEQSLPGGHQLPKTREIVWVARGIL